MIQSEKQVGQRVKQSRESVLMSQQDLAAEMRERGYKWAQATVWNVESGARPLRLTEALDLADICGFDANQTVPQSAMQRGVDLAIAKLEALRSELAQSA